MFREKLCIVFPHVLLQVTNYLRVKFHQNSNEHRYIDTIYNFHVEYYDFNYLNPEIEDFDTKKKV